MNEDEESPFTAEEIDDAIRDTYKELLDVNQAIIRKSRRAAEKLEEIREVYLEQISRISDLIDMHIASAQVIAGAIGDILSAEWDVTRKNDDDEEEEDDDDDD